MALTSTQSKATVTRSTRIKRVSNEATTKDVPSMTGTSNAAGRRQPRALANNEKENINPLTGLDSFQSSKMSKQNSVFAVSGKTNATPKGTTEESAKGRAGLITRSRSIPSAQNDSDFPARPRPRKSTTSHAKNTLATDKTDDNSGGLQSVIDALLSRHAPGLEERLEDTMAGRHLAARQLEAPSDQYARELTVKPLADLSEAFSVPSSLADLVTHNAPSAVLEPHDSVVHEVDADDLNTTLRLLLASADDRVRLPTVLRPRGTKRTLDSSKLSGSSTRVSRRSSTGPSECITPRPTKRIRKSSVPPPPPPNSPVAFRALSLPLTSENVELLQSKEEETEDYHTQDETQGSSHFSSVIGSLSDRAGVSFESLLLQETNFVSQLL